MKLSKEETSSKAWSLGMASALMICLGYPGEIQNDLSTRWFWWAMAMVPFCYVVVTLVFGLDEATAKQPQDVVPLVLNARILTAVSWLTYPFVYLIKNLGLAGPAATVYEQVGYSAADVTAKAIFGVLIWAIASEKSKVEQQTKLLG